MLICAQHMSVRYENVMQNSRVDGGKHTQVKRFETTVTLTTIPVTRTGYCVRLQLSICRMCFIPSHTTFGSG